MLILVRTFAFSPRQTTSFSHALQSWALSQRLFSSKSSTPPSPAPLDQVIRLRGRVDSGYGRGGKKLGFPTANLPASLFQNALSSVPTGVYMGWALIEGSSNAASGRGVPQKAAVNVGYSPTFEGQENKEKIVEAHLILDDPIPDFYDEVMRLLLIGFLRPEEKFGSFSELVAAITNDVETSRALLDEDSYSSFQSDALFDSTEVWIGRDGGDSKASWEFQDWERATNN